MWSTWGVLRILTLNIGSFFERDWERRRHEVVAWLDHLDPDIVCFQEVWQNLDTPNTAGWVAEHAAAGYEWVFGGHPIAWMAHRDPDLRFGSAILSRWPIDEFLVVDLPLAPNPEDDFVTSVPWELLYARSAGLDLFTCHLAAAPHHGRHRRKQVQAIDAQVRELRADRDEFADFGTPRAHMPAILTGDFNAEPGSDEIRWLKGHTVLDDTTTFWQDAWEVAGHGGPGLTQDWRTHELAASLNVHRKRIDYVFVADPFLRAGAGGRVLTARVVADQPLTGVQASDHCGVVVEIEWNGRPD